MSQYGILQLPGDRIPENREPLGSKKKLWFRDPIEREPRVLFKYNRPDTGEDWSEKIAAELATLLGLPHSKVELAAFDGQRGAALVDFTENGRVALVHGNELLEFVDADYPTQQRYRAVKHTVAAVYDVLTRSAVHMPEASAPLPNGVADPFGVFIGYLLLDTWIGNTDRHHENWGLLWHADEASRRLVLAPSFDHASSLGRELKDDARTRVGNRSQGTPAERYARRAKSAFYPGDGSNRPLSHERGCKGLRLRAPRVQCQAVGRLMNLSYEPPALFVNWQDDSSRRIFPVGRLVTLKGDGYEFAYIAAARDAEEFGFAPFQAFPDLAQVYRAQELPAFFRNRLLQPGRPDYPQYLQELGLESATATPVEILARSGGRRVTDPLEVFAELVPAGDRFEAHFFVRGIRHHPGAEAAVAELHAADQLRLRHEPTNEFNRNAHLLICHDGRSVGYVPDYLVDDLKELGENDDSLRVEVVRVNAAPSPSQQRLLCKLSISAIAPRPHRGPRFEPISADAVRLDGSERGPAVGGQRRTA